MTDSLSVRRSGATTVGSFLHPGSVRARRTLPFRHSLLEQVLNLTVYAPELVSGPSFELCPKSGINPQQK